MKTANTKKFSGARNALYAGMVMALVLALTVHGETIPENVMVQGDLDVTGDVGINGTITCEKFSGATSLAGSAPTITLNSSDAVDGDVEVAAGQEG